MKGRGKFVMIYHTVLDSAAFKSLSPGGLKALMVFARRYNGRNGDDMGLGVRDLASDIGSNKSTAHRAIAELVNKGFIEITQRGAFTCKTRVAARYRLLFVNDPDQNNLPKWATWRPDNAPARGALSALRVVARND